MTRLEFIQSYIIALSKTYSLERSKELAFELMKVTEDEIEQIEELEKVLDLQIPLD